MCIMSLIRLKFRIKVMRKIKIFFSIKMQSLVLTSNALIALKLIFFIKENFREFFDEKKKN